LFHHFVAFFWSSFSFPKKRLMGCLIVIVSPFCCFLLVKLFFSKEKVDGLPYCHCFTILLLSFGQAFLFQRKG